MSIAFRLGLHHLLRRSKRGTLTVLSLHRVSPDRNHFWNPIQPQRFEKLLEYVSKNYKVISFSELTEVQGSDGQPLLILSFDDGYLDFYEYALPLLRSYGLPSNHNIVIDAAEHGKLIWTERLNLIFQHCLDKGLDFEMQLDDRNYRKERISNDSMPFYLEIFRMLLALSEEERSAHLDDLENRYPYTERREMMSWDQLRECLDAQVEIGCHSWTHPNLNTLKEEALQMELFDSAKRLEERLGIHVDIMAPPNGQLNQKVEGFLEDSSYRYVLKVDDQVNELPLGLSSGPHYISRINMIDEPISEMILRLEGLHYRFRRSSPN